MKKETLSGIKRVIGLVLFLVVLCLVCSIGYGDPTYKYVPFATQAVPQAFTQAYTNIGLRADSAVRFIRYSSDSSHFLYCGSDGFLHTALVPTGGGSTDTASLSARINARVKYTDTGTLIVTKTMLDDTAIVLRGLISGVPTVDTTSLSNRINLRVKYSDTVAVFVTQKRLNDTAAALRTYIGVVPCVRTDSLVRVGCTNVIQGTVARRINSVVVGGLDTTANDSNTTIVGYKNKGIGNFSTGDNTPYGMRSAQLFGFANKGNGVGVGYKTFTGTSEAVAIGPKCYAGGNATTVIGDACASMLTYPSTPGLNFIVGSDVDTVWGYVDGCLQCGATHITTDFTTCIGCLGLYASDSVRGSITKRSHSLILGGYYNSQNSADFNLNQGWFNNFQFGPDYTEFPHDSVYIRWAQSVSRQDVGYAYTLNKPGQAVIFEVPGGSGNAYGNGMYWTVSDTTISGLDTQKNRHTAMRIGGNGVLTTYFLDNYNSDVSASYTARSKIDSAYAGSHFGTLSQQNTNTSAIATNTTNIATNTTNIASNTTAIAGKQSAITTGTTAQYFRGDLSLSTFSTDARSQISAANAPLSYNSATGVASFDTTSFHSRGYYDTVYVHQGYVNDTVRGIKYFVNAPSGAGNFVRQAFFGYSPTQGICINRYSTTGTAIGADTGTTNQSAINYAIYIAKDKSNTRMSSLGTVNLDIAGVSKLMVQNSGNITIGQTTDDGVNKLQVNGQLWVAGLGTNGIVKAVSGQLQVATSADITSAIGETDNNTTLTATVGTSIVANTNITANSILTCSYKSISLVSGSAGSLTYTLNPGVGFTITSSVGVLDNGSIVSYHIKY